MFDSLFGSNESSRALSAIIMLVRRELLQDPRFTPSQAGTLASLVALTKALTAFACLQVATRRRTVAGMKMRVVWDATVVAESEDEGGLSQFRLQDRHGEGLVGQIERAKQQSAVDLSPSKMRTPDRKDRRKSIMRLSEADREGLVTDVRSQMESGRTWQDDFGPVTSGASSFHSRRSRSFARVNSMGTLASAGGGMMSEYGEEEDEEQEITYELKQMLGEDEEQEEVEGGDDLPEEVRAALLQVARGDGDAEGMEILSSQRRDLPAANEGVRLVQMTGAAAVYEVVTTTTETTTTTTVKTTAPMPANDPKDQPVESNESSFPATGSYRHRASSSRGKVETVFDTPLSRSKSVTEASQLFREDEWVEVASRISQGRPRALSRPQPMEVDDDDERPKSGYVTPSIGALARTTTLESPEEGKQKLQVVLRTMTKKLTQRKHTVRRVDEVFQDAYPHHQVEWKQGSAQSAMEGLDAPPKKALLRTLGGKAKKALTKSPSAFDLRKKNGGKRRASKTAGRGASSSVTSSPSQRPADDQSSDSAPGTPAEGSVPFPVTEDGDVAMRSPTPIAPRLREPEHATSSQEDVFLGSPPRRGPSIGSTRTQRTSRLHRTHLETNAVSSGPEPPMAVYPKGSLVKCLSKYMRYASAAYGQHFLRISECALAP